MTLTVNGEKTELQDGATVAQLLKKVNTGASRIAVLVNNTVVKAEKWEAFALKDGDHVELLTFAGGG